MKPATKAAFDTIDKLDYAKTWDMSGECIVVRETWSEDGAVVRTVEHHFGNDNPPKIEEPAVQAEPSDADVTLDLTGNAATGDVASLS